MSNITKLFIHISPGAIDDGFIDDVDSGTSDNLRSRIEKILDATSASYRLDLVPNFDNEAVAVGAEELDLEGFLDQVEELQFECPDKVTVTSITNGQVDHWEIE